MTPSTDSRSRIPIGLALAALMAGTRGQRFAPLAHHLPDASLAVFFLAGLSLRSIWFSMPCRTVPSISMRS